MKTPGAYTLNEIETILKLNPELRANCAVTSALSNLYMFLDQYEKALAVYKVQQDMHPQPESGRSRQTSFNPRDIERMPDIMPRRVCNSIDRELLDACALVPE